jgi:hypothetical protein
LRNGQIETGLAAGEESLHHVGGLKSHPQLVAGEARLRDRDFRGADGESIAEMDRVFEQTVGGEVLSKDAPRPGNSRRQ